MSYLKRGRASAVLALAVALMALLATTASASADETTKANKARWSGSGQVVYVGPSPDPSAPTSATADFRIRRGEIKSVVITTQNEYVAGVLGFQTGNAVEECKDRTDGATCETLNELLTGAFVSSLHTSTARMTNISESVIQVPLPTPEGEIVIDVPVISGDIRGKLNGVFTISKADDSAVGISSLRIKRGSTATYACFGLTELGLMPLSSLQSCIDQTGGQLLPVALDVLDRGSFEVGAGTGVLSDIESIKGRVEVTAQSNALLGQFGGEINVIRSVATLDSSLAPELEATSFSDGMDSDSFLDEIKD